MQSTDKFLHTRDLLLHTSLDLLQTLKFVVVACMFGIAKHSRRHLELRTAAIKVDFHCKYAVIVSANNWFLHSVLSFLNIENVLSESALLCGRHSSAVYTAVRTGKRTDPHQRLQGHDVTPNVVQSSMMAVH